MTKAQGKGTNFPWGRNTPESRWYALGRYYAMFPQMFVRDVVSNLSRPGELVLDPFCGRGNAPYVASVLGRRSLGIDINPLAWLYTKAKLNPEPRLDNVIDRIEQVAKAVKVSDRRGRNRFERMAWCPNVRGFLRASRRELDWRSSRTDRTLMAFVTVHMQDQLGSGLSNALWPTVACSPSYAVRWWTRNCLENPPDLDPVAVLSAKVARRYQYGIPDGAPGESELSDARVALESKPLLKASLMITSPPYSGVTDYWNDHWIRLWMLGHGMHKDWRRSARYDNGERYEDLILGVFRESRRHLSDNGVVVVRSDRRRRTAETCLRAIRELWPGNKVYFRDTSANHKGVSVLHGNGGKKAKEVDFLIPKYRGRDWLIDRGFAELRGSDLPPGKS